MPPITNAEEADGIFLLSNSTLAISKLLPRVFGQYGPSLDSKDHQNIREVRFSCSKLR